MPRTIGNLPDEPDFAEMYSASPLTPRMAARLWVVAQLAHDTFRQGMADMWLEQLPRLCCIGARSLWPVSVAG